MTAQMRLAPDQAGRDRLWRNPNSGRRNRRPRGVSPHGFGAARGSAGPPAACYAAGDVHAVSVNGEARTLAPGTTVLALLQQLALDPRHVAVERNLEIVPRAQWSTTTLDDGDRLEVVTFVGGG